jgi:hypothetical protein
MAQQPLPALTPHEIDKLVAEYEELRDQAELADEAYEDAKRELIDLVNAYGSIPAGAESSVRLQGQVTVLTVTTGSSVTIKDAEVRKLKGAMDANEQGDLFGLMFAARSKYKLLKGAETALRVAKLPKRLAETFTRLYARCFDVSKKSPTLKIDRLDHPQRKAEERAHQRTAKTPRAKKGGKA